MTLRNARRLHVGILGTAALALFGALLFVRPSEKAFIEAVPRSPVDAEGPSATPIWGEAGKAIPTAESSAEHALSDFTSGPSAGSAVQMFPSNGRPSEDEFPGDRVSEDRIVTLHGNHPLTQDHPTVARVIEVQERNTPWLMTHPAVVGTGVGLNEAGDVAVVVLTKVDAPELPKVLEGIPVVIWKSGEFFARSRSAVRERSVRLIPRNQQPPSDPTKRFDRPVPIGVSTGHPNITAGTIGCRVTRNGQVFALSNNHVYASENLALVGDTVIQPGTYDGGFVQTDGIGTLAEFVPIVFGTTTDVRNRVDAAIALSDTSLLGNATPWDGYGVPKKATVSPAIGLRVKKFGRTTKLTSHKIGAINVTANVGYDRGTARFVGQIAVYKSTFSGGGDSGALIVVNGGSNDRKPVGLLFAGSSSTTLANPIGDVLSAFGVTIDGE